MQKRYSKPKALLFGIKVPYELNNGDTILVSSLSKLQIQSLHTTYSLQKHSLIYYTVASSVSTLNGVTYYELEDIYNFIMDISVPTQKDIDVLTKSIKVLQDKKYQTEDFRSCDVCKARGMDKVRNCPMLDKSTHSPTVIYTFEDDNTYILRECPMHDINNSELLGPALELMRHLEHCILPTSGGMLDQTVFVNEVIPIITPLIDKKRQPLQLGL